VGISPDDRGIRRPFIDDLDEDPVRQPPDDHRDAAAGTAGIGVQDGVGHQFRSQ
jgi:hypothetical protein